MNDAQRALIRLGGGDPFDDVRTDAERHQLAHGCGLFRPDPL